MVNGRAKTAMILVGILTLAGIIAATILFTQGGADAERTGIFVASLFSFLIPTIGILLVIAQGKESSDVTATASHRIEAKVDDAATLVKQVKLEESAHPTALQETSERIESKLDGAK